LRLQPILEGDERERLWNQHVAERPEFREYPKITSRVIPDIVLERLVGTAAPN
jgi:hypothetical protein